MSSRPKMAIEYPSLPGLSGELRWDIWGEVAQSTARIARLGREYYNESLPETPLLRVSKEARSAILTRLKPVIVGPNGDKLLLNMSKDILYLPRYNPGPGCAMPNLDFLIHLIPKLTTVAKSELEHLAIDIDIGFHFAPATMGVERLRPLTEMRNLKTITIVTTPFFIDPRMDGRFSARDGEPLGRGYVFRDLDDVVPFAMKNRNDMKYWDYDEMLREAKREIDLVWNVDRTWKKPMIEIKAKVPYV